MANEHRERAAEPAAPPAVVDALRRVPLFAQLPGPTLDRLATLAEPVLLARGALLIREGDPANDMYVVLDGMLEVTKRAGSDDVPVGAVGPGEVVGETALLEHGSRTASVTAVAPTQVVRIAREPFEALVASDPATGIGLVRTMAARLRSNEALVQQRERMASLGTLAAGLAHELNNPAAAVRRGASLLADAIAALERAAAALGAAGLDGARSHEVDALREALAERQSRPPALDPLATSDLETAIGDVLEAHGVADAWQIAPALAAVGWPAGELDATAGRLGASFGPVVTWLGTAAAAGALVAEVGAAASRLAELVSAVKTYTFLDQAPVQQVDVRAGIDDTLLILGHKLREAGISVRRDMAADLPRIEAYGSELNQAWTNLVDNAIDAMGGAGELRIQAAPWADGGVLVSICDDGPGIPPDVQRRLFDPFFTTKEPGKGTGLGLHIVYSIIVRRHGGRIRVDSRPGHTCFEVTLPARVPG
jgi:signal transduction histidine kinase